MMADGETGDDFLHDAVFDILMKTFDGRGVVYKENLTKTRSSLEIEFVSVL